MRNTMLGLLATPIAAAKGVLPEPASPDAKSKPGDVTANLPLRQFQPFRRTPWLEVVVGYVLNDLESVQLVHRHRDPFRCSHRSFRRWIARGRSAYAARKRTFLIWSPPICKVIFDRGEEGGCGLISGLDRRTCLPAPMDFAARFLI
ncbi:hypothetical protein [Burkholderia sp. B21-005]|uniref:hypothetical protein n=1 Tax=Burkholderia sp. B21-005 TaxID=2890406 RepID=UPI001E2E39A9|nr:hypothetical protein [Burkholderia sp. B21-005]UEP46594.1 hypothetical protein LMA02_32900 [Burkholderia sp. B21-005]